MPRELWSSAAFPHFLGSVSLTRILPWFSSLAVSISAFSGSVGGLIGGSYSTFCSFHISTTDRTLIRRRIFCADGRRPVYLCSLPILIVGSIGVALAQNIPSLLFWRFLQSLGAAPAQVVGAGVTGDIYRLEERGRAMGIFFGVRFRSTFLA